MLFTTLTYFLSVLLLLFLAVDMKIKMSKNMIINRQQDATLLCMLAILLAVVAQFSWQTEFPSVAFEFINKL